jgi:Glycerol-3-phosphate cytidylyltransferase (EC 2.7.7.39)
MKKVITYGTYDLLHVGHINLLRRAKALGDYLIVALSTDEFNAVKNKKPITVMRIAKPFWKPSDMWMK